MQLVSPIINYMTEKGMIADPTNDFADSVDTSLLVMGTASEPLQLWKPYYFDSDDNIDSQKIVGIEVFSQTEMPILPSLNNNVSSNDVYRYFLLTIVGADGKDILCVLPLSILLGVRYSATAFAKTPLFDFGDVIWSKCYVQCIDITGAGINVNDTNILFKVYTKPKS
jgi:hypothetical protein